MAKEIAEPSFLRRREGRLAAAAASSAGEKANLKSKLGMVAKMKRSAAKLAKKASAKKKTLEKRASDHPLHLQPSQEKSGPSSRSPNPRKNHGEHISVGPQLMMASPPST